MCSQNRCKGVHIIRTNSNLCYVYGINIYRCCHDHIYHRITSSEPKYYLFNTLKVNIEPTLNKIYNIDKIYKHLKKAIECSLTRI